MGLILCNITTSAVDTLLRGHGEYESITVRNNNTIYNVFVKLILILENANSTPLAKPRKIDSTLLPKS